MDAKAYPHAPQQASARSSIEGPIGLNFFDGASVKESKAKSEEEEQRVGSLTLLNTASTVAPQNTVQTIAPSPLSSHNCTAFDRRLRYSQAILGSHRPSINSPTRTANRLADAPQAFITQFPLPRLAQEASSTRSVPSSFPHHPLDASSMTNRWQARTASPAATFPAHYPTLTNPFALESQGSSPRQLPSLDSEIRRVLACEPPSPRHPDPSFSSTPSSAVKSARKKGNSGGEGALPSPNLPSRHGRGGSHSGSDTFSMHVLVSRNKNTDNFDYGLDALGIPIDTSRRFDRSLPIAGSEMSSLLFTMSAPPTASGAHRGGSSSGASALPQLACYTSELPSGLATTSLETTDASNSSVESESVATLNPVPSMSTGRELPVETSCRTSESDLEAAEAMLGSGTCSVEPLGSSSWRSTVLQPRRVPYNVDAAYSGLLYGSDEFFSGAEGTHDSAARPLATGATRSSKKAEAHDGDESKLTSKRVVSSVKETGIVCELSRDTFLPFEDVATMTSRGFSSLVLTSFLRQVGSNHTGAGSITASGKLPLQKAMPSPLMGGSVCFIETAPPPTEIPNNTKTFSIPTPPAQTKKEQPKTTTPLLQCEVAHWAKPLNISEGADKLISGAYGSIGTVEPSWRVDSSCSDRFVKDAQTLTIVEYSGKSPLPNASVFTVDDGYTIRVQLGELQGDCETDESVLRQVPKTIPSSNPSAPPIPVHLPSVVVTNAVEKLFSNAENTTVLVMDTSNAYLRRSASISSASGPTTQPVQSPLSLQTQQLPPAPPPSHTPPPLGVALSISTQVVRAFLEFKAKQSGNQGCVVDLKVAVAYVPVTTREAQEGQALRSFDDKLIYTLAETQKLPVRYDIVSTASAHHCTPQVLEVATSPLFGSCINECQWLMIEEESDISAMFALANNLLETVRQEGFLHIQFLYQSFVPRSVDAEKHPLGTSGPDTTHPGDILVSSFTIATSPSPQVFEAILDQRAGTPWPLLRYALGKGPSTVLVVANVHEEDQDAAYPLSILQRIKAISHQRPRRGSVQAYVAEEQRKAADLRMRLAAEDGGGKCSSKGQARSTAKRLGILLSKLDGNVNDALDFLMDPEHVHVPVYVVTRRPVFNNAPAASAAARAMSSPQRLLSRPQVVAIVTQYNARAAAAPLSTKELTRWATLSSSHSTTLVAYQPPGRPAGYAMADVTSLHSLSGSGKDMPESKTWLNACEQFGKGFNVLVALLHGQRSTQLRKSLQVVLQLSSRVADKLWSDEAVSAASTGEPAGTTAALPSSTIGTSQADEKELLNPLSDGVRRATPHVSAQIYHVSGNGVADLLTANGSSVIFDPIVEGIVPLGGTLVPLNITKQIVGSKKELRFVFQCAMEALCAAQKAARWGDSSSSGVSTPYQGMSSLTQECLRRDGYTVFGIELTQRVTDASTGGDEDDVLVSSFSVVNLGGNHSLFSDALKMVPRYGVPEPVSPNGVAAESQLVSLLFRERALVICAAVLEEVPTDEGCALLDLMSEYHGRSVSRHLYPGSVRFLVKHLSDTVERLRSSSTNAYSHSLACATDALEKAQGLLAKPGAHTFQAYPRWPGDVEMLEASCVSPVVVDGSVNGAQASQLNFSSTITTGGTTSIGCSSIADTSTSTVNLEKATGGVLDYTCHTSTFPKTDWRDTQEVVLSPAPGQYYGIHYQEDPVLRRGDISTLFAYRSSPPTVSQNTGAGGDGTNSVDDEAMCVSSVVVLNAPTTSAYIKREGSRIFLYSNPQQPGLHFDADEVLNIKPTSMGMKSSLLTRTVSCVSRGRTAALLISDTESCDAASSIAWLTLRTVIGGIFQSLKGKEVEGTQYIVVLRAFLIEEDHEDQVADLLSPCVNASQRRTVLRRLKHSPFCGPMFANATTLQVRDLQDINSALTTILFAARLAHDSTPHDDLQGAITLQLTVHQFKPACHEKPQDVCVSSLWCVHMGCSVGWMDALQTAPSSTTSRLLHYFLGGPCYTTAILGVSRFSGVRTNTWRELFEMQRRVCRVTLRRPRLGSVADYITFLLARIDHYRLRFSTAAGDSASAETEQQCSTPSHEQGPFVVKESVVRLTALLHEAQRLQACFFEADGRFGHLVDDEQLLSELDW